MKSFNLLRVNGASEGEKSAKIPKIIYDHVCFHTTSSLIRRPDRNVVRSCLGSHGWVGLGLRLFCRLAQILPDSVRHIELIFSFAHALQLLLRRLWRQTTCPSEVL